jgi:hypothetical protein
MDVAVLDWIVAEGLGATRFALMQRFVRGPSGGHNNTPENSAKAVRDRTYADITC